MFLDSVFELQWICNIFRGGKTSYTYFIDFYGIGLGPKDPRS